MNSNKLREKIKSIKGRLGFYLTTDHLAWKNKMKSKYGLAPKTELKVWDGTMTEEAKKERNLPYDEIDKLTEELLKKGYRIVKSSAITPKGNYGTDVFSQQSDSANAQNLFYEQTFDEQDFIDLYDRFGRYENNFPDYFKSSEAFKEYVKTHDIWVIEDIKTNRPVGFSTICISNDPEERALYQTKEGQTLLYHDTVAIDSELQDKGIGSLFAKIFDAYYLRYFADKGIDINYALCTGEINTSHTNRLSKNFHETYRGFGNWVESTGRLEKWLDRYKSMSTRVKKHGKPEKPGDMNRSYNLSIIKKLDKYFNRSR